MHKTTTKIATTGLKEASGNGPCTKRIENSFDCEEDVLDLDIRLAKAVNHLTIALAEYKKFEKEAIRKWGRDKYYINAGDPLEDALSEINCAMIADVEYRLKEKHNLI